MGWRARLTVPVLLVALLPLTASAQEYVPEEGSHQGAKMEMWNLHGHLFTPDGRAFGLTTMFFNGKYLVVSGTAIGLGLTDEQDKKSAFEYDFFLPLFGKVVHTPGQLDERYGPNHIRRVGSDAYELSIRMDSLRADLAIRTTRPPLPYAGTGLVRWETHESRGYSFPRAQVTGEIAWKGALYPVTGHVNMDHAWSNAMEEDHDLFMVQLDDGTDANVLFRHDRAGKGPLPGSFVALAFPDGRRVSYDSFDVSIEGKWKSPKTGRFYPNRKRIRVPDESLEWGLLPSFDDQEFAMMMNMTTSNAARPGLLHFVVPYLPWQGMAFWAGTGTVAGAGADGAVKGRYCGVLQGYGKK
ncbi:MAG: hypothetical protein HYY13_02365 [Nitrospirae bacterium]|nr:hypothetical protein [Nitrospirota bacterium]